MMSENYESRLKNGKPSDVVLAVGGKELNVHKQILASRSPVFSAMFTYDSIKEAQDNRVEIDDVDVKVLKLMVRYIYTGKVNMLDRYAADLLVAADKYLMDSLKSICEQHLLTQISTESATDLFIFADLYYATKLYDKCLDYITHESTGTRVFASKSWKKILVRSDLLASLFKHLISKYSDLIKSSEILLVTADKYQLDNLKPICKQQLLSKAITTDSVLDLIILADIHQVTELYIKCLEFIANNFAQVISSGKWDKVVVKTDLLAKICERLNLDFAEQLLLCPITAESVSNLLILADTNRVTKLVDKCHDYIIDNATQVMASIDWKNIELRADLLIELFKHLYLKHLKLMQYITKCSDSDSESDFYFEYDSDYF